MTRVVIVQQLLAQYRVPFYEALRTSLSERSVQLVLVHGKATGQRAARHDEDSLSWATRIENRTITFQGRELLVWQPAMGYVRDAELVIVEHANRMLLNYLLLLVRPKALAFWGHGANLQAKRANSAGERFKRWTATRADWWFAYTDGSADRVAATGFPASRITVVQNAVAIDTGPLETPNPTRLPFQGVFVGALQESKGLPFLLEASRIASDLEPRFRLVIVGDGPLREEIERQQKKFTWLTYCGPRYGFDKFREMQRASVTLVPSALGLVVLDSFATGAPIVTRAQTGHGPEEEYLSPANAIKCAADITPGDYAGQFLNLMGDPARLAGMRLACLRDAEKYTMSSMVERFTDGIFRALDR